MKRTIALVLALLMTGCCVACQPADDTGTTITTAADITTTTGADSTTTVGDTTTTTANGTETTTTVAGVNTTTTTKKPTATTTTTTKQKLTSGNTTTTVPTQAKDIEYGELYNPVASTGNDPWIIRHGDDYYYCWSNGPWVRVCQVPSLDKIPSLKKANYSEVYTAPKNTMYSEEYWAPELH